MTLQESSAALSAEQSGGKTKTIGRTVAAAAPLAARVDPTRIRRHWLLQRWDETPCWLTSLVVHMTLVIVLGSLTLHVTQGRGRLAPLLMTVAESAGQPETTTAVLIKPEPIDEGTQDGPTDLAAAPDEIASEPPDPFDPIDGDQPGSDEQHLPTIEQVVPRVAATMLLADVAGMMRPGVGTGPRDVDPDGRRQQVSDDDEVVDRFIEYDIGRLRGEEGRAARLAFSHLGEDAIPALVRGLNRSAYISASCPVVVISRKLTASMDDAEDPQSLQYVIDHLGRDVPHGAPHARVLRNVRAKALAMQQMRARHQELREAGRDITWREFKQLQWLSLEQPAVLARSLRSPDAGTRLAAALAAGMRAPKLNDRGRLQLGRDLCELLDDADPRVRDEAQVALAQLAPQMAADIESGNIEEGNEPFTEARAWRRHWAQFEKTKVTAQAAGNQFRMAKSLAEAGKIDVAKRRYRKLRRQYPGTEAALAATKELNRLGEL